MLATAGARVEWKFRSRFTLDDLADTNASDEVISTDRRVEPGGIYVSHDRNVEQINARPALTFTARKDLLGGGKDSLLVTLVVGLGCILQPAGVLDGDGLAALGLRAAAGLKSGLGDAHDCCVG